MKVLVTGGAGFIGANFTYWLLNKNNDSEIVCLDLLTYAGNIDTLSDLLHNPRFSFVHGDIADSKTVFNLVEKGQFDVVINFAAESHVDRSIENPAVFLHTNIIGTQVIMDACLKYNVKRFHQVSTDEVYGDLPLDRTDLFFTENTPLCASSPYSASKASADLLVLAYHRTFGLPVTISRCSNNYGPFQFPEKLIPLMIVRALKNETLPVYGDGKNVRDWIHVTDHCNAIYEIICHAQDGQIYNVGGNNEMQNIDVVKLILNALGKPESLITYVTDRPGHDRRYAINSEKLSAAVGWVPSISFNDGIQDTIRWYLENDKWWKNIMNGNYRHIRENLIRSK